MSMARRTFPSRLELNSVAGSSRAAPWKNVSFTTDLYVSPVQIPPSCDHTGVPIHFHSSRTSGSASRMRARSFASVSPRQSPSSAIFASMSFEAAGPVAFSSLFFTPLIFVHACATFNPTHVEREPPLTLTLSPPPTPTPPAGRGDLRVAPLTRSAQLTQTESPLPAGGRGLA